MLWVMCELPGIVVGQQRRLSSLKRMPEMRLEMHRGDVLPSETLGAMFSYAALPLQRVPLVVVVTLALPCLPLPLATYAALPPTTTQLATLITLNCGLLATLCSLYPLPNGQYLPLLLFTEYCSNVVLQ